MRVLVISGITQTHQRRHRLQQVIQHPILQRFPRHLLVVNFLEHIQVFGSEKQYFATVPPTPEPTTNPSESPISTNSPTLFPTITSSYGITVTVEVTFEIGTVNKTNIDQATIIRNITDVIVRQVESYVSNISSTSYLISHASSNLTEDTINPQYTIIVTLVVQSEERLIVDDDKLGGLLRDELESQIDDLEIVDDIVVNSEIDDRVQDDTSDENVDIVIALSVTGSILLLCIIFVVVYVRYLKRKDDSNTMKMVHAAPNRMSAIRSISSGSAAPAAEIKMEPGMSDDDMVTDGDDILANAAIEMVMKQSEELQDKDNDVEMDDGTTNGIEHDPNTDNGEDVYIEQSTERNTVEIVENMDKQDEEVVNEEDITPNAIDNDDQLRPEGPLMEQ